MEDKLDVTCPECGKSVLAEFQNEEGISPIEADAFITCSKCGTEIHIIYEYKLVHIQVA